MTQQLCLKLKPIPLVSGIFRKLSTTPLKQSFVGRDFLTLKDLTTLELETLLWTATDLKSRMKDKKELYQPLKGKALAMIFQKRSTRTRVSTEIGFNLLGGSTTFIGPEEGHLGVNESVKDTARVLSGFVDVILARVYGHEILTEMAKEASIPVINGLSDMYHPVQILADMLTLQEVFGHLKGHKIAWVGDGNNIVHSFLMGCPKLSMELRVATPKGYECNSDVIKDTEQLCAENKNSKVVFTNDPLEAVDGATVIVTDTWVSMGQETEKQQRLKAFKGYCVTRKMLERADKNWKFLHCLPRKANEVDDDVFYDEQRSLVWQEAENRLWTVMAVLLHLITDHKHLVKKPDF